jgi:serine kinase of HPr protein (carbohydrate metabolism regulator)
MRTVRSQASGRVKSRPTIQVHATCVEIARVGVLLCGSSGSGKSDLALRLIDAGGRLVADDRVDLRKAGTTLWASAPAALAGLLEVRGVGIVRSAAVKRARLGLIVEMADRAEIERLPEARTRGFLGIELPLLGIDPFAASAAVKIRVAAKLARQGALFAH